MKTIFKNKLMFFVVVLLALVVGCDNSKNDVISNAIYLIDGALKDKSKRVSVGDVEVTVPVGVRLSQPIGSVATATISVDPDFVAEYNKRNGTEYVALPQSYYSLTKTTSEIHPGEVAPSQQTQLTISPMDAEILLTGLTYAVPLSIESTTGGVSKLESSSKTLYIVDIIPYADVPRLNKTSPMVIPFQEDITLNSWTVEFLFKIDNLATGVGKNNNQILFNAFGATSTDRIFSRFGDTTIPGNKFQVKAMKNVQIESTTAFDNNKWYHMAIVNDGSNITLYVDGNKDISVASEGLSMTLSKNQIRFCGEKYNDSYMKSNVWASEIRLWSVARSSLQIKNNRFGISPQSVGLEGYWKLNDGAGSTFKDYTVKENTANIQASGTGVVTTPIWSNQRLDGQ